MIFGIFTIIYLIEKFCLNNFKISDKIFKVLADDNSDDGRNDNNNDNFISLKMDEKFSKNNNNEDISYSFEELLEKDEFLQKKFEEFNRFLFANLTKEGTDFLIQEYKPYLFCLNKKELEIIIKTKNKEALLDRALFKTILIQIQIDFIDIIKENK